MRSRREAARLRAVLEQAQQNNAEQVPVLLVDEEVVQIVDDALLEDMTDEAILLPDTPGLPEGGYGTTRWFKDGKGEK